MKYWLVLGCLCMAMAAAAEPSASQADLQRLEQEMESLQDSMGAVRKKREKLLEKLKQTEEAISKVSKKLRETNRELNKQQIKSNEVRQQRYDQTTQLERDQKLLAAHLQTLYTVGEYPYLKLLFSQKEPLLLGRLHTYYIYFNEAQRKKLQEIKSELSKLEELQKHSVRKERVLQALQTTQLASQKELKALQDKRNAVLKKLDAQLKTKAQRLAVLQQDKKRLQGVLDTLVDVPHVTDSNIMAYKGNLPWPVKGVKGQPRYRKSEPLQLIAKEGDRVRAIYPGTVIFSDWLKGFGFLVIVQHDEDTLSLYGFNQALLKTVGQKVTSGEEIAVVGRHTSVDEFSSLHFEIRRRGQTVKTLDWLRPL